MSRFSAAGRIARDKIDELLSPHGFEVTLRAGGRHHHVVCQGPIRAVFPVGEGAHTDRQCTINYARQWARRVIRQLEGRA